MDTDEASTFTLVVHRLGLEFPDRSLVQIATAVLDAWDRALGQGLAVDAGIAAQSARMRLG